MGLNPNVVRPLLSFLALAVLAFGQAAPSISNVTNAAIPALDNPPNSIHLPPRSMATIFGSNLADFTASSISPWPFSQGGTEVHLADDTCFDSSCDLIAVLIYVSPTQINFLVPDNGSFTCKTCTPVAYRIVLVRDGQRIDNRSYMLGGPGRLIIDPYYIADYNVVFQVGYDCLFSYSLSDPASCGLSWSQGQHRAPTGAITDGLSGQLISSQAPVHQGQVLTLWMTGLYGGVTLNSKTGLLQQTNPAAVGFGVAQSGTDVPATIGYGSGRPFGTFVTPTPIWAGESPEFTGLDQVNVAFPTCINVPTANAENRYDAFLTYTSVETSTTVRLYLPFIVRSGDPDCHWTTATSTVVNTNTNPSAPGQTIMVTATVLPTAATGTVTFLDGNTTLGTGAVSGGKTTYSTSTLSAGTHSIVARYNGDDNYAASTSSALTQTVWKLALTSSLNPSFSGQSVTFTACGIPSGLPGILTFLDGTTTIGVNNSVSGPCSTFMTSILTVGSHSITARYSDSSISNTSAAVVQTVTKAPTTPTTITLTSNINPAVYNPTANGTPFSDVMFTATVSPAGATGLVKFYMTNSALNCTNHTCQVLCYTYSSELAPKATCSYYLPAGTFTITAVYGGDSNFSASTSQPFTQTVHLSLTSSPNPSIVGQSVIFVATPGWGTGVMSFYDGTTRIGTSVVNGQTTFSTTALSVGTHSITAVFTADPSSTNSTSDVLTQTVNVH